MDTSLRLGITLLYVSLAPSSALADWQFTKWGDTLEQVLSYKVDSMERTTARGEDDLSINVVGRALATSEYSAPKFKAAASYLFADGKLSGVNLEFQSPEDADAALAILKSQYDPSIRENTGVIRGCVRRSYVWRDDKRGNAIAYNYNRCGDGPISSSALFTALQTPAQSGL